jgi:hypothetical protein
MLVHGIHIGIGSEKHDELTIATQSFVGVVEQLVGFADKRLAI